MFDKICKMTDGCHPQVLEQTIQLAVEVAREGREGRKVGTIFVLGDEEAVLKESSPLILDPLQGHPSESKKIDDVNMRETAKELSQLDGAFVVSADGIVISAARYLNADSTGVDVPLGLGTRHMAAAAITRATKSVAVVVSESSVVRVFHQGKIIGEIIPEIWMLGRESIRVEGPYAETKSAGLHIVARELPDKAKEEKGNGS
ncbi:MAG: DNA integrity scanning protein DisA nucleotide-binding domain protein [Deltaproteobacteria bacterium]|nr:DNA integrity scanning protein DisA nucleotide-binding domain protein [Deltaproteobacteria bacterium]MBW2171457.1 DNA integrity scanning protein DisA nucleotide-binding domain protein [Deltaproteobacteria bacterium]